MLINNFFTINQLQKEDGAINADVTVDKNHDIFKGHFPGQPVVPGVCLTQIIKEVLQEVTRKKLMLTIGSNIKFMAVVNPDENPNLNLSITYKETEDGMNVSCSTSFSETVAFKFKGTYSEV